MIINRRMPSNVTTFCDVNCPKCGCVAKLLDYYLENKETIECPNCGYEQTTNRETTKTQIRYGYGVLYAEFLNKPFMYLIFDNPISQQEKESLLKIFDDFYIIKEKSYFYLYEPHTDDFTILKGAKPQIFEEYVEEQQNQMDYERFLSSYRYQNLYCNDFVPFE